MFASLPPDLLLYILSFLGLRDIFTIHLLSRDVHGFLRHHESQVFHQLAISHRFAYPGSSLQDAVFAETPSKWLNGVETWKDLVRRWTLLERNWSGHGTVLEGGYSAFRDFGLRTSIFAVDERDGTIITSGIFNMLTVLAIEDNRQLWSLPQVPQFRWSEGLLTFVNDGNIEVWRRSTDVHLFGGKPISTPILPPSPLAAVAAQFERESENISTMRSKDKGGPTYEDLRGQYTPHALIIPPSHQTVRLVTFQYPVVALVTHADPYVVHLYDVAQGIHIRSADLERIWQSEWQSRAENYWLTMDSPLNDIHLSERHIAACFDSGAIVLPIREVDETKLSPFIIYETENSLALQQSVLQLRRVPRSKITSRQKHRLDSFMVEEEYDGNPIRSVKAPGVFAMEQFNVTPPAPEVAAASARALILHGEEIRLSPAFASIELSPDERHLAIVTGFGLLYLIPEFNRIAMGMAKAEKLVQRVYFGSPLNYITWDDHSRRFALKTEEGDTFIVDIDPLYHSSSAPRHYIPDLRNAIIHRLADFRMSDLTRVWTHMQLTRTRLWLVWDPQTLHNVILANARVRAVKGHLLTENEWRDNDGDTSPLPQFNPRSYNTTVCFIDFMSDIF